MDDGIGKVGPVSTGKDSMSIRGEHTTTSKPKARKPGPRQVFINVLQQKEAKITEEEKKKKQQPHAKYRDGKRII